MRFTKQELDTLYSSVNKTEHQKIITLYRRYWSMKKIAEKVRLSESKIRQILSDNNVSIRVGRSAQKAKKLAC